MPPENLPVQLIRRSVANSIKNLQAMFNEDVKPKNSRPLRYESLEDRRVLSANGFEPAVDIRPADTALVTTENYDSSGLNQTDAITRLLVEVNGQQIELTPDNNLLQLAAGDSVKVISIGYSSDANTGVFAAEGYVNKIGNLTSASLIDYNDGRFSDRSSNQDANGGDGTVAGLSDGWSVETGWDRMTINLMHYTENSSEVAGRFFVNLQVGQPDFQFDTDHLESIKSLEIHAGDKVSIPVRWLNGLAGQFHNYAEVDIYHSSNMNQIVWSGAAVGNADSSNVVEGEFLNKRGDFSERWTPMEEGEYVLKYYLDPEAVVAESNEANNQYEIRLKVSSALAPEAVDDRFEANTESLDVLKNDLNANPSSQLKVAEFSQAKHGTVSMNVDGTLQYTPEDGFHGQDEFNYVATDGNQLSNKATVTVEVEKSEEFEVESIVSGKEDSAIGLEIRTDYDAVLISGVPAGAELSNGQVVADGTYLVSQKELDGLQVIPAAQSDRDFQLTVTPVANEVEQTDFSKTIDVEVIPVVDGGELKIADFGILAGSSGNIPLSSYFSDLDGSEKHEIVLSGMPDFMKLSRGERDGSGWRLTASDLEGLQISSSESKNVSGWTKYEGKYLYKSFEVKFTLDSYESNSHEMKSVSGSFNIFAWQKRK